MLDVHDTGTIFSSTLSTGNEVLMFDANSDTYSQFFMNYSGLSSNNDSTDGSHFLRARFVPNLEGTSPTDWFTPFSSGQPLTNNRVVVARFKYINRNVFVNDNETYHGSTIGGIMMQIDGTLSPDESNVKATVNYWSGEKDYCMFTSAKTLVLASFDAYNQGSDEEGNWKQYHFHDCVGTGTSNTSDYLEEFSRNNPTKIYQSNYAAIEVSPTLSATTDFEYFNYVDLKWLIIFPSPLFVANGIPQVTVTKRDKTSTRLYK
ncbi:hypothetical protein [Methanobrevibacter sp.]|uniref:hypothetical protein n=1 Tax=Methanobrevibacter sp. TaxID=66852 RepID=UPI0025DF5E22|nr:hypothetical protein [Methanobrevibacter sp.]MBQ2831151.1 hypothetical protein [Methanobrevibacter sp.]